MLFDLTRNGKRFNDTLLRYGASHPTTRFFVTIRVLIFEFFMPLTNETHLRTALDALFYKDTILTGSRR